MYYIVKGVKLVAVCPEAVAYCYLEFKLRYLKNWNCFQLEQIIIEPIVIKGNGSLLFLKSIFLRNRFWVTLGDFTLKNAQLGKEICI